jgi:hypothetical protein
VYPGTRITGLVALIQQDIAIHEEAGNFLKADIERQWCEGTQLHFAFGQGLSPTKLAT